MNKPKKPANPDASRPPRDGLKILFADDEPGLQELMSLELPQMGHQATVCPDGLTAAAAMDVNHYDCLLVDLDMPGLNGIEVLTRARQLMPDCEAIVMTGKSSLETAVAALRQGAFDYLTKPCKLVELESVLARVAEKKRLRNQCRAARHQLLRLEGAPQLVGEHPSMDRVRQLIAKVAPTSSTVLILGETGSGKELAARAVHEQSPRVERPFVAVNCGALPENLIESELFGHRKGAFTGADEHRVGLFEMADGGTIFLDEIGELPKSMQAKLLRVLESGEIRRVGDNESFRVDVRAVCATHRNLPEMVEDGDFREDLMFRINTFEVALPPLRNRTADIELLARHLWSRFRPGSNPNDPELFSKDAVEALQQHVWPGNVRELANVVEHATILCDQPPITPEHLPAQFSSRKLRPELRLTGPVTLRELEEQAILEAIERNSGNKTVAAQELGVSVKTLYNRLNQAKDLKESA